MIDKLVDLIQGNRPFLDMFRNMAETVTHTYVEQVYEEINTTGVTPSFDQLMDKVRALHDDLSRRAVWIREDYKEDRGRRSTRFTRGCKGIIDKSCQDFLRTVKLALSRRNDTE